jgi:hypothetical protein
LHNRPHIQCTHRRTRQQGSEQEEVPRADDDDVELLCVDALQQARSAPSRAEDDEVLLLRVEGELGARVPVLEGNVVDCATRGNDGDEGDTPEALEEAAPDGLADD